MEHQFTHNPETFLGHFERAYHRDFVYADKILDRCPKIMPAELTDLHAIIEEEASCFAICRDTASSVKMVKDLHRQIGQRLTEAKVQHLRSDGELKTRWNVRVSVYNDAFRRISEEGGNFVQEP